MLEDHYSRLFQYDHWANQRALLALQSLEDKEHEGIRLFCHILAAQEVWYTRLTGNFSGHLAIWPLFTLSECREIMDDRYMLWKNFMSGLRPDQLLEKISYHNSRGLAYENPIGEILTHVINHGTYHRGQIALLLRKEDHTPAVTDFIAFLRHPEP